VALGGGGGGIGSSYCSKCTTPSAKH